MAKVAMILQLVLGLMPFAQANMVILSATRTIASSARNDLGANQSDTQAPSGFADFDGFSLSNVPGAGAGTWQESSMGPTKIFVREEVSVGTNTVGDVGFAEAIGRSVFQVTFVVSDPTLFQLQAYRNGGYGGMASLQLESLEGNIDLDFINGSDLDMKGMLQPSTYTLTGVVDVGSISFEPGMPHNSNSVFLGFKFTVIPVPDAGPTPAVVALLVGGFMVADRLKARRAR